MERLENQRILIAGRIITRHVYCPEVRCGGMYMRYGKCWHQVSEVAHAQYTYYAARTLDVLEGALIEEQVEATFHSGQQASVK